MKKLICTLIIIITFTHNSFSAGTSSVSTDSSNYTKAYNLVKSAKKYEKKGKTDKAQKKYKKAQEILLKLNKEKPLQADTLNYLGFTTRKLGDYIKGEDFYLQGLKIEPKHIGINEYLGELYVVTKKIDKARERLEVLKDCDCKEYNKLKEVIEGTKKSKY
jgi:tetratricopeptide (TPR) repeat protein|tara:strand:+ start:30 stop:512 length:483 start_codon:yes stop_codon:yes gene_type:complete